MDADYIAGVSSSSLLSFSPFFSTSSSLPPPPLSSTSPSPPPPPLSSTSPSPPPPPLSSTSPSPPPPPLSSTSPSLPPPPLSSTSPSPLSSSFMQESIQLYTAHQLGCKTAPCLFMMVLHAFNYIHDAILWTGAKPSLTGI